MKYTLWTEGDPSMGNGTFTASVEADNISSYSHVGPNLQIAFAHIWDVRRHAVHVRKEVESGPVTLEVEDIPEDYPVRPLTENDLAKDRCQCGACGLSWDDAIGTSMTPSPAGRCPFEGFHEYEEVDA